MATGICAKITKETVNKIIFPKYKFNYFNKRYVDKFKCCTFIKGVIFVQLFILIH